MTRVRVSDSQNAYIRSCDDNELGSLMRGIEEQRKLKISDEKRAYFDDLYRIVTKELVERSLLPF